MDDRAFDQALREAADRARRIFQTQHGYGQARTEARLKQAGVGERTVDAEKLVGKISVQGGVTLVSRSATPAVGADVGTRATTFQAGRVKDIRVKTEVAPVGGPLGVRVLADGVEVATVTIPDGGLSGYAAPDASVGAGTWFTFDFTSVGATTPGGRVYVAIGLDVDVRRGGATP